jgi:hypothetical protein
LIAEQAKEFRQNSACILLQVHIITGQKFAQKVRFLVLNSFDDKLVVGGYIKN